MFSKECSVKMKEIPQCVAFDLILMPLAFLPFMSCLSDDVEFEVSADKRTGKPIAVKLVKIKAEVLPEERISGQVGPDLHASPFTMLHGYIHPVKEYIFSFFVHVSSVSFLCFLFYISGSF